MKKITRTNLHLALPKGRVRSLAAENKKCATRKKIKIKTTIKKNIARPPSCVMLPFVEELSCGTIRRNEEIMGLDMYLSVRKYASEYSGGVSKYNIEEAIRLFGFNPSEMGSGFTAAEIKLTAIYWRKANAIHNWFVNKVQNGVDDCGSYEVSMEQLLELQSDCEVVLAFPEKASSVLPTASGFFFGGTEFDDWYYEGIRITRDKLAKILTDPTFKDCEFEYQSSW